MFQKGFVVADAFITLAVALFLFACGMALISGDRGPSHLNLIDIQKDTADRRPPITTPSQKNAQEAAAGQNGGPGTSKVTPLYIQAQCEHGCGYSEDNKTWFKRFRDDPNAFFALWVAIFTGVLAWIGYWQGRAIYKQIALAREEFISTHRPKLELKEVSIEGADILYMLANTGGTEATIIESWILVEELIVAQPIRNLRSFGHDDLGRLTFAPGEIRDLTRPSDGGGYSIMFPDTARIQVEDRPRKTGEVHFVGALLYEDGLGNRRRSVFRRRWDAARRCFCRMDNPDYEYAD